MIKKKEEEFGISVWKPPLAVYKDAVSVSKMHKLQWRLRTDSALPPPAAHFAHCGAFLRALATHTQTRARKHTLLLICQHLETQQLVNSLKSFAELNSSIRSEVKKTKQKKQTKKTKTALTQPLAFPKLESRIGFGGGTNEFPSKSDSILDWRVNVGRDSPESQNRDDVRPCGFQVEIKHESALFF